MHIEAHSSEPLVNLKMKRTIPRFFSRHAEVKSYCRNSFLRTRTHDLILDFEKLFYECKFRQENGEAMLRDTLS